MPWWTPSSPSTTGLGVHAPVVQFYGKALAHSVSFFLCGRSLCSMPPCSGTRGKEWSFCLKNWRRIDEVCLAHLIPLLSFGTCFWWGAEAIITNCFSTSVLLGRSSGQAYHCLGWPWLGGQSTILLYLWPSWSLTMGAIGLPIHLLQSSICSKPE